MQPEEDDPLKLYFQVFGDENNPTLLILHGLFGSSTNWRSIIRQLSEELYVVAADMRNHGQSPWSESMDYPEMAKDIAALITDQKLQKPVILGHSMGGKAAMTLAQMGLVPVDKLIIADIAPVPYTHSHETLVQAMLRVKLEGVRNRSEVQNQLAESILNPGIRQFLLQNLVRENGEYRWRINLQAIENNMASLLDYATEQTADNQTLFIAGSNSDYIQPDMYSTIKKLFPNSRVETIKDAGHWIHAEKPSEFVKLVRQFVN